MAVSNLARLAYPASSSLSPPHAPKTSDQDIADKGTRRSAFEKDLRRLTTKFRNLDVRLDTDIEALLCSQLHPGRPCFSLGLLDEVMDLQVTLKLQLSAQTAKQLPFGYLVWASSFPGIYNLGGDLKHFCSLVREQDAEGLHAYAKRCVDICHLNATSLDLPILTVALVQGDALGGGFESVLSNDLIIAEAGVKFGLPEVVFNLFPGMGAYSFLSRRMDAGRARDMIMSGRLYTAEELYEMGIVDVLCARGEGERELRRFIEKNERRHHLLTAMAKVGKRCQPVTYEELIDVAELWVDTTLSLRQADLRRMERLVIAQDRRRTRLLK
jgi:DSF synthase